ncbi:MAG: 1-(5-phosphoribosyl)-5-[(5-phosphoribosylamino)methylideneamino]imidazole-4-carboxamide isomerase [Bacteroidetes bacterium CG12_big_fil_rev_8_21_14_0_65_60_17]|nr:MAG: 1-(5-phosphoribosyl)-5-[(5-phosphoribosylamino)methylideneamino]imidazole-4-carboxamide isomerase [Bacteroidetes bacterium CG12_big_fil_rev_8_21_14_0_65_60_17]
MLLIIPAIDLRGGACVRLYQGSYEKEKVYFEDPVKMARLWRIQNAKVLHVVDLDAARGDGKANNRAVITDICAALDIPVQTGGGIRTLEDVEHAFAAGVYRVILGTAAVREPKLVGEAIQRWGSSRIVVGIDAKNGEVRVDGWLEGSGVDAIDFALEMEALGCCRIVYTDISRDGTLEGPNLDAYREMGSRLKRTRITASGGVGDFKDLMAIASLTPHGVDSVIVGRALYENRFPCQQFWSWNDKDVVDLEKYSTARTRGPAPESPGDAAPGGEDDGC